MVSGWNGSTFSRSVSSLRLSSAYLRMLSARCFCPSSAFMHLRLWMLSSMRRAPCSSRILFIRPFSSWKCREIWSRSSRMRRFLSSHSFTLLAILVRQCASVSCKRWSFFNCASMFVAELRSFVVSVRNCIVRCRVVWSYVSAAFAKWFSRFSIEASSKSLSTLRSSKFLFFNSSHWESKSCLASLSLSLNCCSTNSMMSISSPFAAACFVTISVLSVWKSSCICLISASNSLSSCRTFEL
mmetsp:Transcript_41724/g.85311  ORF Transcript_41724/g.85311 Transcript_41724/m.85311 type:complete len:241 (-) Transcript_41724:451-1173(-)